MKYWLFLPFIFSAWCVSCDLEPESAGEDNSAIAFRDSIDRRFTLENLLDIPNEAELIRVYGNEYVTYDTMWGAEGFFTMGTILKTEPATHVEITWSDSGKKQGIISVTLVSDGDFFADTLENGLWKSRTGVYIGMSVNDLQKVNGRPFTFSGFGWDYGGGVMRWEGGALEGKGLAVQLAEGPQAPEVSESEYNQVIGDIPVTSDNLVVKKLQARVWSISIAKVQ